MIGRYLSELCSDTDDSKALYPLTPRYVSEHLRKEAFGKDVGSRKGLYWLLDDDDVEKIKASMRANRGEVVDLDVSSPSGLSERSKWRRPA